MKHRLLVTLAIAALACGTVATTAVASHGGGKGKGNGRAYQFRGDVVSASSTSLTITVEGGDHTALRAMLGQTQNQTFTLGSSTEILVWSQGKPTVGDAGDLKTGDWVQISLRSTGTSLQDIESTPVAVVGDRGANPAKASHPLFLFRGTVSGAQSGGHIALHVTGGNALAMKRLIGQSADQTFTYDDSTIFLLWQGKQPTVIDASKLQSGDRITVRIRAAHNSTLAQVESTPAVHVGDHEPATAKDNS